MLCSSYSDETCYYDWYRDANGKLKSSRPAGDQQWSGEATRGGGFRDEARVDVTIGDNAGPKTGEGRKERPIWMVESTVITDTVAPVAVDDMIPEVVDDQVQFFLLFDFI